MNDQLLGAAHGVWRGGFASGAEWMRRAMGEVRGEIPDGRAPFRRLGSAKYALCLAAALLPVVGALTIGNAWPLLLVVPAFYAAEAQMVFLFPVALDGGTRPFRASRRLVARAGGTWRVAMTVLPIAAHMLTGGFLRRGLLRGWCDGALAVVLWYERVRGAS